MADPRTFFAPDLDRYIEDEPGAGFIDWCNATADKMAEAKTPDERAYARLLRAMVVATIESANAADSKDGVSRATVSLFVPRAAMTATIAAMMSCFTDATPTRLLREVIIGELDFVLSLMAPGQTIGADHG